MLVPGSGFAALGAPLAHLFGIFFAVGQEHAAARTGNNLVAVKTDGVKVAQVTRLLALVACAKAFGGIFDNQGVVFFANGTDFVNLGGGSVQMNQHNKIYIGVNFKSLFERDRIHVPGFVLGINKHGLAVFVGNGVHGSVKGHVAAEHLVPTQGPLAHLGHAIQSFASKLGTKVKCRRSGRKGHRILAAHLGSNKTFEFIDVRTNRTHPVGLVSLGHELDFVTVHRGA